MSLALIDERGMMDRRLASDFPSENFHIPQGWKLSWEQGFPDAPTDLKGKVQILKYKTAQALLTPYKNYVSVSVESPNVADLRELIEIVILCFGGEIHLVDGKGNPDDSFVRGLKNDLRRLGNAIARELRHARQAFGLRMLR